MKSIEFILLISACLTALKVNAAHFTCPENSHCILAKWNYECKEFLHCKCNDGYTKAYKKAECIPKLNCPSNMIQKPKCEQIREFRRT